MSKKEGYGSVKIGSKSEEELAFAYLFPGKTDLQRLQMISDYNSRTINPFSVLGVLRRLFSGNGRNFFDPWYVYQEEYSSNRLSLDRKSRLEASEIVAAVRRKEEED